MPNPDVLLTLSKRKGKKLLVGFAAETEKLMEHAEEKYKKKKLDLLVANQVGLPGQGFESDNNAATLLWPGRERERLPLQNKAAMAERLAQELALLLGTALERAPVPGGCAWPLACRAGLGATAACRRPCLWKSGDAPGTVLVSFQAGLGQRQDVQAEARRLSLPATASPEPRSKRPCCGFDGHHGPMTVPSLHAPGRACAHRGRGGRRGRGHPGRSALRPW